MKTHTFDAAIDCRIPAESENVFIALTSRRIPAVVQRFSFQPEEEQGWFFVRIQCAERISVLWNDTFALFRSEEQRSIGRGKVLSPAVKKVPRSREKKHVSSLQVFMEGAKSAVEAVVLDAGFKGINEQGILERLSIRSEELSSIGQELESEGHIRILSFSPLFLLSQEKFEYLCEKMLEFIARYHKNYPNKLGVKPQSLLKRFDLHPRILSLAVSSLQRQNKIKESGDAIAAAGFQIVLTQEEEKLLAKLEELYLHGRLQGESLETLRKKLKLTSAKLDKMISLLIERKKIVQSKDGYILHATWLAELIEKIKNLKENHFSVAEFKEMTGLSRKYAIPLLELLDQMKITQRKGQGREIIRE